MVNCLILFIVLWLCKKISLSYTLKYKLGSLQFALELCKERIVLYGVGREREV